ncbi:MAG: AMP-binding protein [Alphaproteobacteria bacterium]|jgi:cyclohexanecarboxylate-CoA ligase|nr:AMP-binding protein [Alphaproteobacteria bacterium]MDP6566260.1 AMP-binding protein [Alphaproteobacteria bacterium]MDP6814652.1 AMP-binding protein [Alphaproteobacteria bacterium]
MDLGVILPQSRIDDMVNAGAWPDRILLDYLEDALARRPERPAITTYNGETGQPTTHTFGEFDQVSRRIALALIDLGVGVGDVVSLLLPNWWQFNAMAMACARIGAIANPLMPIFRERELTFMLGFAETRVLIAPRRFRGFDYKPLVDGMRPDLPALAHVFYIDGEGDESFEAALLAEPREGRADADAVLAARRPAPDDVNEVIYTSGTTGQPKGVMHTANTTLGHLGTWIDHHGLSGDDTLFMASPLAHQTGFLYALLMPVMLGAHVVLLDRWEPPLGVEIIQNHRCTWTMGATPFLSDIVEMPNIGDFDIKSLRAFISAGAPIPPVLVQKAAANFDFKVLSGWGMTECACSTICDPGDPDEKVWTSDGGPLPHTEVTVQTPDGETAKIGEEGLLKVRGQPLFVGYLKKPELHGLDADGWFDSGDLAFMDKDGYIRITGRSKDIIIRGGENVPVVEIEDELYRHPAVQDAAVVGAPDDRLGERGCAFVTLRQGEQLDLAGMIGFLEERGTAKQYWPESLVVIDEMPRTPSGKIQKFKLRDQAKDLGR